LAPKVYSTAGWRSEIFQLSTFPNVSFFARLKSARRHPYESGPRLRIVTSDIGDFSRRFENADPASR
jgi:hypothetical protein